jgi:hypothetical protein
VHRKTPGTMEGLHTEAGSATRTEEAGECSNRTGEAEERSDRTGKAEECSTLTLATGAWHYTVDPPPLPALAAARTELEDPAVNLPETKACRLEVEGMLRPLEQNPGTQRFSPEGHTPVPEGVLPRHHQDETGHSPDMLVVQASHLM